MYVVGYTQGNGEYVYVSDLDKYNVKVTTFLQSAISFEKEKLAKDMVAIAKSIYPNQDYVALKVDITIEEVK